MDFQQCLKDNYFELNKHSLARELTVFICSALCRCCAPLSSISLPLRSSVVSVYNNEKCYMRDKSNNSTLLWHNAAAKYWAPALVMQLLALLASFPRYMKKKTIIYCAKKERMMSHSIHAGRQQSWLAFAVDTVFI